MKVNKNIILTIVSVMVIISMIFVIWKLICFGVQNSAINMEEQIETSKSNIDIILQKRIDELTQLVNTVKDSKKFESEALEKIIQARNKTQHTTTVPLINSGYSFDIAGLSSPEITDISTSMSTKNQYQYW